MPNTKKVFDIVDGDTLKVDKIGPGIRLANVYAPEKGQKGYGDAMAKLAMLTKGKQVTVTPVATDVYGRTVAQLKVGNKSVNKAMNDYLNKK